MSLREIHFNFRNKEKLKNYTCQEGSKIISEKLIFLN